MRSLPFIFVFLSLVGCGSNSNVELIESELNGVEIQEKIWSLSESGLEEEAQALRDTVAKTLRDGNCNTTDQKLNGAGGDKKVISCDHGIHAIFKPKKIPAPFRETTALDEDAGKPIAPYRMTQPAAEVAAYQLDLLLKLNVVPVTVERYHSNLGYGSAQYLVRNVTSVEKDHSITGFRKMQILDFIIRNTDRTRENWLYLASSNHIVAIDHGNAFGTRGTSGHAELLTLHETAALLKHEPELQTRLLGLKNRQIKDALAPYIRNFYIDHVKANIHRLQEKIRSQD